MDKNSEKPLLELRDVSKRFDSLEVLKHIDLALKEGETMAILGPSGSGKSTLLHLSGLMEEPSQGEILLNERFSSNLTEKEKAHERLNTIGFMFQFHYLLPDFNLLENILMPTRLAGDPLKKSEKRARELLDRLGLSGRLLHKPAQLSGGEQQRAALARALIRNPKLLLCDEPTGNLDPHTAQDVIDLIWAEVQRNKLAALIVTHNELLAQRADRVCRLKDGCVDEEEKVMNA